MRRYRLVVEAYEDDQLIRRMEERSDQMKDDCSDGEQTIGMLLSLVPAWAAAACRGCGGVTVLASMCERLPYESSDEIQLFRKLGKAYDDWAGHHDLTSCVEVRIDQERLECTDVECSHRPDGEAGGGTDKTSEYRDFDDGEIDRAYLSVRTRNALILSGIRTIDQLANRHKDEIAGLRNIGKVCMQEIEDLLAKEGKRFAV